MTSILQSLWHRRFLIIIFILLLFVWRSQRSSHSEAALIPKNAADKLTADNMSRIFITGSSDGIGLRTARALADQGHRVVLHARSAQRAEDAKAGCPGAETVLIGDLSSLSETKQLARDANALGRFDCVIHNAGLGYSQPEQRTAEGVAKLFAVNTLAAYVLTALMERPQRLVYLSSGLHSGGDGSLRDLGWTSGRAWNGFQAYQDSKLHNVMLAFAFARRWPDVASNSVDPEWVPTKMGGFGAPGDIQRAVDTLVQLAVKNKEGQTGKHWRGSKPISCHSAAKDTGKQDELLEACQKMSGISLPK